MTGVESGSVGGCRAVSLEPRGGTRPGATGRRPGAPQGPGVVASLRSFRDTFQAAVQAENMTQTTIW